MGRNRVIARTGRSEARCYSLYYSPDAQLGDSPARIYVPYITNELYEDFMVMTQSMEGAKWAALADGTRRAMLARLAQGEATVSTLAEPFAMSQPAISRHIKVLLAAGLITQRVDGPRRPCRLQPEALSELDDFITMLKTSLEQNYDRLDQLLGEGSRPKGKT